MSATTVRSTKEIKGIIETNIGNANAEVAKAVSTAMSNNDIKESAQKTIVAKAATQRIFDAFCRANKELFDEYAKASEYETYSSIAVDCVADDKNAVEAIVMTGSFEILKPACETDDDGIISKISTTAKDKRVNLASFDKVYKKYSANGVSACNDDLWVYGVSKLNQLFCLKKAKDIGAAEDIIKKTYFLEAKAKEIKLGKTPTSNTQLLNNLQAVIDMIIFEDNEGKNKYKATSHDVSYINSVYCKISSKSELGVTVSNDRKLMDIIVRVLKRIITNGTYSVDGYREVKSK